MSGIKIPVEAFPPKIIAIKVIIKTPSPFIPAFPIPRIKEAKNAKNQFSHDK